MITTINEFKQYLNENTDPTYTYKWSGFEAIIRKSRIHGWQWNVRSVNNDYINFSSDLDANYADPQTAEYDMFNEIESRIGSKPDKQLNESIGDITLTEIENKKFNDNFIKTLNNIYTKENNTTADWSGIHAWKVSGTVQDGIFIVQDENASYWDVAFDLIHRYDDAQDEVQVDTIASLTIGTDANAKQFLDIAKSYEDGVNERSEFDAVAQIGKITKQITIELDLKHSMHSMERQGRSDKYIKNSDIKETVDKATEQIVDLLIDNTLNVGDPVWIYNSANDLNVVGSLLANKHNDNITFRVITCMFHKNFYNKNNTYKVTV